MNNLKVSLTLCISTPLFHTVPELPQLNKMLLLKERYTTEGCIFRVMLGPIWIMKQVSFSHMSYFTQGLYLLL